jgi:ribosomal protein S18 acetylase RimI-like enzyme
MQLNKEMVSSNAERLMEIDGTILDEEGNWTLDNFLLELNHKWDFSFVALIGNQIVGFIICSVKAYEEGYLHIHRLAVLPKYQNQKIGSTLLNYICELCSKNNIRGVILQVKKINTEGQKFYEKQGFKKIGSNVTNYVYKKGIQ